MRTDFDFAPLYRATVGFDRVFDMLDSMAGQPAHGGYPPYNIEKTADDAWRIVMAVAGWWDNILEAASQSHVYINGFGYLAISMPLLVLWLVVVLFFDRKMSMVFAPGQLLVRQDIGSGEVAYDTGGMVVAKRRSDLFRHWLLGFGSGDLLVKTGGAHPQQFEMPNVLFVGNKLHLIQEMLQTREVVSGEVVSGD